MMTQVSNMSQSLAESRLDAKLANSQICTFYYCNTTVLPGKGKLRNKYNIFNVKEWRELGIQGTAHS